MGELEGGGKSKKSKRKAKKAAKAAAKAAAAPSPPTTTTTKKEMVEETITEQVPVYSYSYPVNALSLNAIEDNVAEALYRQFVVAGFQESDPAKSAALSSGRAKLGGIIGFDKADMDRIGALIAGGIYENYIATAMDGKNDLDQQDMMFLAQIQDKLEMTEEMGERLLIETQKQLLNRQLEKIFTAGTMITPSQIKDVRNQAVAMDINLGDDLGIETDRLGRMFTLEIEAGIEDGTVTAENGSDAVVEVQESLGLTVQRAQTLLENMVQSRCGILLQNISSDVMQGNDIRAVADAVRLVKFVKFVGGGVDLQCNGNMAEQIVNVYAASDASSGEEVELLKGVLTK